MNFMMYAQTNDAKHCVFLLNCSLCSYRLGLICTYLHAVWYNM